VVEILALEKKSESVFGTEVRTLGEWRRSPHVVSEHVHEFDAKLAIRPSVTERCLDFLTSSDQRLGNVAAAVVAEEPFAVGLGHHLTVDAVGFKHVRFRSVVGRPSTTIAAVPVF
jgi:hypothetical protein